MHKQHCLQAKEEGSQGREKRHRMAGLGQISQGTSLVRKCCNITLSIPNNPGSVQSCTWKTAIWLWALSHVMWLISEHTAIHSHRLSHLYTFTFTPTSRLCWHVIFGNSLGHFLRRVCHSQHIQTLMITPNTDTVTVSLMQKAFLWCPGLMGTIVLPNTEVALEAQNSCLSPSVINLIAEGITSFREHEKFFCLDGRFLSAQFFKIGG